MRYVIFLFICIFSVSLDCAFFPSLGLFGLTPDITLFIVISFSLLQSTQIGLFFAVAAGVLKGLYAGTPIGIAFAFYIGAAVFSGMLKKRVSVDNVILPAILTFLLFIIRDLLISVYMFFINNSFSFTRVMTLYTLPCAGFTAILALALYFPLVKLNKKHFMTSIHDREL